MSNHRAQTWDHRGSKPLGPKLLPLGHHLDGFIYVLLLLLVVVVRKTGKRSQNKKHTNYMNLIYFIISI
jgi:hypothetical protein